MATLTIFFQAGVPVMVGVALVCNEAKKMIKKRRLDDCESYRRRKKFEAFRLD